MKEDTLTLYRFCSGEEAQSLLNNHIIKNHTDHYNGGKGGSTSIGFCLTEDEPIKAWGYLKGIVTPDVCKKLEIDRNALQKSKGKYFGREFIENGRKYIEPIFKDEWCTTILRPEWLRKVIILENIIPMEELQSARYYHNMKLKMKQINEQSQNQAESNVAYPPC